MKRFIALLMIVTSCGRQIVFSDSTSNDLEKKLMAFEDLEKNFTAVKDVPPSVIRYLDGKDLFLSDSGSRYNETDLNYSRELPNGQLIFGARLKDDFGFLLYETNGIKNQTNLLIYKFTGHKNAIVEKKYINCRPKDFFELKNCIAN